MKKMLWIITFIALGSTFSHASEQTDVRTAKNEGKICELGNGFVKARDSKDNTTQALVEHVNNLRRENYAQIAARNSTANKIITPEAVAQEAAKTHPHLQSPKC